MSSVPTQNEEPQEDNELDSDSDLGLELSLTSLDTGAGVLAQTSIPPDLGDLNLNI